MVNHYFPLIGSAPNLSRIHLEVNQETEDSDIIFLRDSHGWKGVDRQLCRLAEMADGPVTLILDTTSKPGSPSDVSEVLDGPQFLPEFLKAGGLVRFE